MIQVGAFRHSNSPWASAVILVRKRDGSLHFCIDLRKLNARTIKDAYSLPHIDETLDCLGGAITYKYVQELKERLENAFQKANAFCEKEAIRSKQHFDRTARCSKLLPGDLVLVKQKRVYLKTQDSRQMGI